MPPLDNPKHEAFCREFVKGKTQEEAYEAAGYVASRSAASRLFERVDIRERISELQERNAMRVEIGANDLIDMLLQDRQLARDLEQVSASVSALDKVARIIGAYAAEKREHSGPGGGPIETADMSQARLASALAELPEGEREALRPLLRKLGGD